jgi:glycerol-3-phosphate cytidylyltransferase
VAEAHIERAADKVVAWQRHGFDVLFKGSDWQGTEKGARLEHDLAQFGVTVAYLPYTTHTSTSLLRPYHLPSTR